MNLNIPQLFLSSFGRSVGRRQEQINETTVVKFISSTRPIPFLSGSLHVRQAEKLNSTVAVCFDSSVMGFGKSFPNKFDQGRKPKQQQLIYPNHFRDKLIRVFFFEKKKKAWKRFSM